MRYDSEIKIDYVKEIAPGPFREEDTWGNAVTGTKRLFVVWEDGTKEELSQPLGKHPSWRKAEYLIVHNAGKEDFVDISFCVHTGSYDFETEYVYRLKK